MMENIPKLFPGYQVEIVMVNDGAPDACWEMMKSYQKLYPETIRITTFVKNCGQAIATYCGVQMARGDVIGVISQDMQDPFELFVDMLQAVEEGSDLALGVREQRQEKGLGVLCSKLTHYLMHHFVSEKYPEGGSDFCLMTREVAKRYLALYRKGSMMISLLESSVSTKYIPYVRMEREHGKSGYSFAKKVNEFTSLFVANSCLPLRLMSLAGFFFSGAAFLFTIVVFIASITTGSPIPVQGWASLALLITFFSGLILAALGVLGEYLWRVYDEVIKKPLFMVADTVDNELADREKAEHS